MFSLPFYAILILPILVAAGMRLMDTTDGMDQSTAVLGGLTPAQLLRQTLSMGWWTGRSKT